MVTIVVSLLMYFEFFKFCLYIGAPFTFSTRFSGRAHGFSPVALSTFSSFNVTATPTNRYLSAIYMRALYVGAATRTAHKAGAIICDAAILFFDSITSVTNLEYNTTPDVPAYQIAFWC